MKAKKSGAYKAQPGGTSRNYNTDSRARPRLVKPKAKLNLKPVKGFK